MTIEDELVEFAQSLRWDTIPSDVRDVVIRLTSDAIANAISGRGAADTRAVEAVSRELYGPGSSTIIAGGRASLVGAVGVNAFQMTAHTMCDVYRPGLCHVTPEVVPAALGIAERRDKNGTDLLTAVAAGLEATTRLCHAFNYPSFRARGWHSPGIAGAMGASIAAGLLNELRTDELTGCLGLAGAQAGGTFASLGTMAVKFHQLRGAQSAVIAAAHARRGLLGSRTILSATDGGLLRAYSDDPLPAKLVEDLGTSWHLLEISMRPYPAASSLQSLINVLLSADVDPVARVVMVHIDLPPEAFAMGGDAGWESELRAMQSARFVAAAVVISKSCWTELFDDEHRHQSAIVDFAMNQVRVSRNDELPEGGVKVVLETTDGAISLASDIAQGDPRNPLTSQQLIEKAQRCFAGSPLENRTFALRRLIDLQDESSVASLMKELGA